MKVWLRRSLGTFFLISLPVSLAAAPKPPALELTQLIQEALDKNPSLRAKKHSALAIKGKIGPAGSYPDPVLQLEYSNYPVDTFQADQTPMTGRELRLVQKIPFPGKLSKKRRSVQHKYRAARERHSDDQHTLIRSVKLAYYQLYLLHRRAEIANQHKATLKDFIKSATSRYKTGKGIQQDVLRAQTEFSTILGILLKIGAEIEQQRAILNAILDREPKSTLGKPKSLELAPIDFNKVTPEALNAYAVKLRPMLKAHEEDVQSAEALLSHARWDYLPDFEIGLKYRFRDANLSDSGTDFFSAFVGFKIPLYFVSKQIGEHRAATHRHAAETAKKAAFERKLSENIYRQYVHARENKKLVELYRSSLLPQAEQALRSAKSAYKVNKIDFITLLSNEKLLFQNRNDLERAMVSYQSAVANLEAAVGQQFSNWDASLYTK